MNLSIKNLKPFWFLLIGIATISTTHMSFGIDFFAWFSVVPFLLYLSNTKGWKSRLLFIIALIIDITKRKETENKIRDLNINLEIKITERTAQLNNTIKQLKELNINYKKEIFKRLENEHKIKEALK